MGRVGEELGIDFVMSTGDNFYETGLTGVDDQAFEQSFTNVYRAKSLQKPWYLGELSCCCLSIIPASLRLNELLDDDQTCCLLYLFSVRTHILIAETRSISDRFYYHDLYSSS
jgi:hypothetical protein